MNRFTSPLWLLPFLLCWISPADAQKKRVTPAPSRQTLSGPDEQFGTLFQEVQLKAIFPDSKTFADCTPKVLPATIMAAYAKARTRRDFDLKAFVNQYFTLPVKPASGYTSKADQSAMQHIIDLWPVLTRPADTRPKQTGLTGSLIPLAKPYVVPGGRFGEIYYWDSYFTMLGLQASGQTPLIRNMVDNFAFLINTFGFIPNGNRTYFLGRSQPPFFSMMVNLLSESQGKAVLPKYLPYLQKDKTDGVYEVSVIEMGKLTGKKYNYQQLRLATEGMGSRMFEVSTPKSYIQLWMFQRIEYVHGTGIIEVEFTNPIKPYLFDLKDNFTSFQLYAALRLSSKYAKRIYTLCSQWKDKGQTQTFSLDEFKKMLSLLDDKGNEQYRQIGQLKQFVLDESVKQINQHTDLQINYTLEKKGRSFKNITFIVKAQPLAVILPVDNGAVKMGAAPVGVSDAQYQNVRLLLEKWNIKRADVVNQIMNSADLIQEVNKFAYELQTGKVKVEKNVAGYLLTRLGLKQPKGKEKEA